MTDLAGIDSEAGERADEPKVDLWKYDLFFIVFGAAKDLSIKGKVPTEEQIRKLMDSQINKWAESVHPCEGSHKLEWISRYVHEVHSTTGVLDEAVFIGKIKITATDKFTLEELAKTGAPTCDSTKPMDGFGKHMRLLLKNCGGASVTKVVKPSKDHSSKAPIDIGGLCRMWYAKPKEAAFLSHTGEPTC